MRREELERLTEPYSEGADELDARLPRRLGVAVPSVQRLGATILVDFDDHRHGVGWWAPHPGRKRRILISDYLWQAVHSIQTNLVEAALHLWEARDAWDRESAAIADVPQWTPNGKLRPVMPSITTPMDEMPGALAQLHVAGFFRAIGSAVDCAGAAVVGVAGLRTPILRADMKVARQAFAHVKGAGPGPDRQRVLQRRIDELIEQAGPQGWLAWATDYRNMLVHRARRTSVRFLDLPKPVLVDRQSRPIVRARAVPLLPVDPARSEIEVLLHHHLQPYIEEEGGRVLDAVLESTRGLVDRVAAELGVLWAERKANPALITQPKEQWPDVTAPAQTFLGYAPKSYPLSMDTMVTSPSAAQRIKAAALDTVARKKWDAFD
jgi:hypothetical protein